ncbi:MAG: hypothetical protein Athens041674_228 [Parcubacteria group bacterium Athens0416_74]|nr:MAG: hypothetical protein Athens041674_228 [Parcubacteria group bacterium Athens0416_74]
MQSAGSRALITLFVVALSTSSFSFAHATVAVSCDVEPNNPNCINIVIKEPSNDPCPGSGHLSTGEGPDAAYEKGTKVCGNDEKKLFGGCDSDPYAFLEQRHHGDKSNSFVTPRGGAQNSAQYGLNPGLACRLKKFMEFAETKGCRLTINSAMRPVQRCNPNGGACAAQGSSCHQYGLAVDVGGSTQCLNWILATLGRQNANSPFGIHSAYAEHAGYRSHPTHRISLGPVRRLAASQTRCAKRSVCSRNSHSSPRFLPPMSRPPLPLRHPNSPSRRNRSSACRNTNAPATRCSIKTHSAQHKSRRCAPQDAATVHA